jgi:hypothetical protein
MEIASRFLKMDIRPKASHFNESENRNAYVKKYPTIIAKQAVVCLSAKTGTVIETAQDAISDLMANKGRLKYELGVGKKEEGIC